MKEKKRRKNEEAKRTENIIQWVSIKFSWCCEKYGGQMARIFMTKFKEHMQEIKHNKIFQIPENLTQFWKHERVSKG